LIFFILELFINKFEASNKSIENFVKSYDWVVISENKCKDLEETIETLGYYDLFLIDLKGNILYSVKKENDLGINLFKSKLKNTNLSKSVMKSIKSGKKIYSNVEFYEPSGKMDAFLTDILLNENGDKIGSIALQIDLKRIDDIVNPKKRNYRSYDNYLIGDDLYMKSNSSLSKESTINKIKIETEQAKLWKTEHVDGNLLLDHQDNVLMAYVGRNKKKVIGNHYPINILGTKMGLISEVNEEEIYEPLDKLRNEILFIFVSIVFIVIAFVLLLVQKTVFPILKMSEWAEKIKKGDYTQSLTYKKKNEIGELGKTLNTMVETLKSNLDDAKKHNWLEKGLADLNSNISGDKTAAEVGNDLASFLCKFLDAYVCKVFLLSDSGNYYKIGSYADTNNENFSDSFNKGVGLAGQVALDKEHLIINDIPDNYLKITSNIGDIKPESIAIFPCIYEDETLGIIEIGKLSNFKDMEIEFIKNIEHIIGISFNLVISRIEKDNLLNKTREQAGELELQKIELSQSNIRLKKNEVSLQERQEELEQMNEELSTQKDDLLESESKLQTQKEELRVTNEELEEKTQDLILQKNEIDIKNKALEKIRENLSIKADELEMSSKYKSEFLASMSHELRTPLNSILILSQLLTKNKNGTFTDKEIEYSNTINTSGKDLLNLINEVLDLSKIEAGHMSFIAEKIEIKGFADEIERSFKPLTIDKGIDFNKSISKNVSEFIVNDRLRLYQILKNILSNAIKFTEKGSVSFSIYRPEEPVIINNKTLQVEETIAFKIKDTGVGIPENKQKLIFEAFLQADGSTSRKFGGTGLGLSISKELAKNIGGKLFLNSEEGKGSEFTLIIPEKKEFLKETVKSEISKEVIAKQNTEIKKNIKENEFDIENITEFIIDDRKSIIKGDKSILVIEDDINFAKLLAEQIKQRGFKVLVAESGEIGLHFADFYLPSAIILDIGLPGIDGFEVMERLKNDKKTRHIPVHFMSASDEPNTAMQMGAIGFLTKPIDIETLERTFLKIEGFIDKKIKQLLIIEDDVDLQKSIVELIGNGDVKSYVASNGVEALKLLDTHEFDCMILDLGLSDISGFELLKEIKINKKNNIPVIIYTGKVLSEEEDNELKKYSESIIIKSAKSPERLLEETTLFLHRIEKKLPDKNKEIIERTSNDDKVFKGKKILLVDDDMRNIFALSNVLEEKNMEVIIAKNGQEALDRLKNVSEIDFVLMDIMMPVMDGFEAIGKIRKQMKFKNLPIIALTAKAMKGDRDRCINVGANDYTSKPINVDKLLSLMKVWLH